MTTETRQTLEAEWWRRKGDSMTYALSEIAILLAVLIMMVTMLE